MEPFINRKDIQTIRAFSDQASRTGQLTQEQLGIIYQNNWFNIYVPNEYGGAALDLPDAVALLEQLAAVDASLGWTVTLCSGANWFIGFLPDNLRKELFSKEEVCFSGSGMAGGVAEIVPGGYRVNGRWKYATGATHATAFTANCFIQQNGKTVVNAHGDPEIRSFIFKPEEVTIYPDWNAMGMKATASHSFGVKNLFTLEARCFVINKKNTVLPQPVFYFPFMSFAEVTLAANFSGMALHWLQCCGERFALQSGGETQTQAQQQWVDEVFRQAEKNFRDARVSFFDAVYGIWNDGVGSKQWDQAGLESLSRLSHHLVVTAFSSVQQLYPYCGLEAATENTVLNRIWLDIHTARQHSLFRYSEAAGS